MTAIEIDGDYSEEKDAVLYREVSAHCKEYVTKLALKFVNLQVDRIATFPNLKELELSSGALGLGFFEI